MKLKLQPLVSDATLWRFNYYLGLVGQEKSYEELRCKLIEDSCLKDIAILETIEKGDFAAYSKLINLKDYSRTSFKGIDKLLAARQYCKYSDLYENKEYLAFVKHFVKNEEEIIQIINVLRLNYDELQRLLQLFQLEKPNSSPISTRNMDSILEIVKNEVAKSQEILNRNRSDLEFEDDLSDSFNYITPSIPSRMSSFRAVSPNLAHRRQNFQHST